MAFRFVSLIFDVLTFLVLVASTTLSLLFAVDLLIRHVSIAGLALAAAVVDILNVTFMSVFITRRAFANTSNPLNSNFHKASILLSILFATVGAAMTITTLVWMQIKTTNLSHATFGHSTFSMLHAEFVLWALSVFLQLAFFIVLLHERHFPPSRIDTPSQDLTKELPDTWESTPPMSLEPIGRPYSQNPPAPASPVMSTFSFETKTSDRSSLQTGLRAMSSRTRLIRDSTSTYNHQAIGYRPASLQSEPSQDDPEITHAINISEARQPDHRPSRPSTPPQRRLETIPGSRPNSPGKPLDGPFPAMQDMEDIVERGRQSRAAQQSERNSLDSGDESRVPPRFRKEPLSAGPSSPIIDESHIHPLFRTDSPHPPPTPTLGTTVTASAFGGQLMLTRPPSRSGSQTQSRTASPEGNAVLELFRPRPSSSGRVTSSRASSRPASPRVVLRSRSSEALRSKASLQRLGDQAPPLPSPPATFAEHKTGPS